MRRRKENETPSSSESAGRTAASPVSPLQATLDNAATHVHDLGIAANPMAKTNHFGARISQRGIRQTTVDLALKHGVRHGEKYVLGKKQIKHLMGEFDQIRKNLCAAMDKGGVVVVASDGVLITAYDFDSYRTY